MKWTMLNSYHFVLRQGEYTIDLKLGGFYPYWEMIKDGQIIDAATRHHPVTSDCNKELAAKAQCERVMKNKTLKQ